MLVVSGFSLIAVSNVILSMPNIQAAMMSASVNAIIWLFVSICSIFVCTYILRKGKEKESVPLCLAGFYLTSACFGLMTASILPMYTDVTITNALVGTVFIATLFGGLGFAFPSFFQKIQGLLVTALIAVVITEIVFIIMGMFTGVYPYWIDYVVLLIFCGFIGYDFYHAVHIEPTKVNAVVSATSIYLDLLNVFLRLMRIFLTVGSNCNCFVNFD